MDLPNKKYHTWKEVSAIGPTFYKHWWHRKTQVYRQGNLVMENTSYEITVRESLHMEHLARVHGLTRRGMHYE